MMALREREFAETDNELTENERAENNSRAETDNSRGLIERADSSGTRASRDDRLRGLTVREVHLPLMEG